MIHALRGTKDVLPADAPRWQEIERLAREVFGRFGYSEIRTPVIEETALFKRSVGEETDIVKKEMFSFLDRGERDITLRPEGTAAIVRAYLENKMYAADPFQKLYYIGPMFRAERPQAGRMRQFHQAGVECIGSADPARDAEVIRLLAVLLETLGVKDWKIKINNLGCREDKKRLSALLRDLFGKSDLTAGLCDDCKKRAVTNPLRLLDCKNEKCRTVVREHFKDVEYLCKDCVSYFDQVRSLLDLINVPYELDPYMVRGLDYYTNVVFEVVQGDLGAQNAIGAGGRYDNLIEDMGGQKTGACGFAVGIERILLSLEKTAPLAAPKAAVELFVASLGDAASKKAFVITDRIRAAGVATELGDRTKSLKSQMRSADKSGVRFVAIIGDDEVAKGMAAIRDMSTKEQTEVPFEGIAGLIKNKRG